MVTKTKPKDWTPMGIDGPYIVDEIYTEKDLAELVEHLKINTIEERQKAKGYLVDILKVLELGLHQQERPNEAQIRAALIEISKYLKPLKQQLNKIDPDTLKVIQKEADSPEFDSPSEEPRDTFGFLGDLRFSEARQKVKNLVLWVDEALKKYKAPKKGAPAKEAELTAVIRLADLWGFYKGQPTRKVDYWDSGKEIGEFRKFANQVLSPLLNFENPSSRKKISSDLVRKALPNLKKK